MKNKDQKRLEKIYECFIFDKTFNFESLSNLILEQLKIMGPAVRLPSGEIISGKLGEMHIHVYLELADKISKKDKISLEDAKNIVTRLLEKGKLEVGFVDSNNKYRSREEAWKIAKGYNAEIEELDKELTRKEKKDSSFKGDRRFSSEISNHGVAGYYNDGRN